MTIIEAYCDCTAFKLWYATEQQIEYCRCGHPRSEHLDGQRTCIGEVVIYHPEKVQP